MNGGSGGDSFVGLLAREPESGVRVEGVDPSSMVLVPVEDPEAYGGGDARHIGAESSNILV